MKLQVWLCLPVCVWLHVYVCEHVAASVCTRVPLCVCVCVRARPCGVPGERRLTGKGGEGEEARDTSQARLRGC